MHDRRSSGPGCGHGRLIAALVLVLAAGGCKRGERSPAAAKGGAPAGDAAASGAPAPAPVTGRFRAVTAAESLAEARDVWNKPEVVRRLAEAGLVVIDPAQTVHRPELHVPGNRLQVSGAELEIYVYDDVDTRRRDAAALDTVQHGLPSLDQPRYIMSGNLVAVLRTPHDRLAERVTNALTARHNGGS
jgi:hypothetical protein